MPLDRSRSHCQSCEVDTSARLHVCRLHEDPGHHEWSSGSREAVWLAVLFKNLRLGACRQCICARSSLSCVPASHVRKGCCYRHRTGNWSGLPFHGANNQLGLEEYIASSCTTYLYGGR